MKKYQIIILLMIGTLGKKAAAQLNPMAGQFYLNQYLGNPAFAGIDSGLNIGSGFRQQWTSVPGGPKSQAITAEYELGKVGLGLNFYNDKAGLIKRTRTVATYAYHLPLNGDNRRVYFGLSMGFLNEKIYNDDVVGTEGDVSVSQLNQRQTYVDGDFGAAYITKKLTLQGTIPNLKGFLKKDERRAADQATFYSAVSYKISAFENAFIAEPKVCYRGVRGFKNIVDLGTSISLIDNQLLFLAIYHSTKDFTFGSGFCKNNLTFQGVYTTESAPLRGATGGSFELNMKIRLFNNR